MLAFLLSLSLALATVIDRVEVVVDDQLIMASDVALEEALAPADHPALPFWRADASSARDRLLAAALVRRAAGDLALYEPAESDVRARLDAVRDAFTDREQWLRFLSQHGHDESSFALILRRRMVVESYLSRNVTASPTDEVAWLAGLSKLIDKLAARARIRIVPPSEALAQ